MQLAVLVAKLDQLTEKPLSIEWTTDQKKSVHEVLQGLTDKDELNDDDAKATVRGLLESFGWRHVLDLGGLQAARGMEMYLPLWLRLMGATGTPMFNVKVTT